ncbi:MAG: hypothetical protein JW797_17410 [Bradymonadales bacterium]|nr:hypothetical protein [Bradymonadales bacterium]
MNSNRALFIPIASLRSCPGMPVSPFVLALLRDHAAMGYRIMVVTDHLDLCGQRHDSCAELLCTLRNDRHPRYIAPLTEVILLKNSFDPGPFWDAARRFNLSLERSIFVNCRGEYLAAARTAGVGRSELHGDLFGQAA